MKSENSKIGILMASDECNGYLYKTIKDLTNKADVYVIFLNTIE